MKIFHGYDTREDILPFIVFSRVTIGNMCACTQQVDTTDLFLWNLGRGQFIDFKVLFDLLDKWSGDGTKIYTFWKLLKKKAFNNSLPFTMT